MKKVENGRVEQSNGDVCWFKDGKLHRDEGLPAVERSDGTKEWWVGGQRHRDCINESGMQLPAVEWSDGGKEWWANGELHRDGGLPAIEDIDGSKQWYVEGVRHRDGGLPAVERNGAQYWFENGVRHRMDGPALESADGSKRWYKRGLRHRMDGPAVVVIESGVPNEEWFIEGIEVEKEKHPWWISEQEKKRLSDAMAMTAPSMSVNCSGDVCISDVVLNDESKKNKKNLDCE